MEPPSSEELETCPFDAGREDRTPPETLTLGDPWRVRVVPNLYPAFERQEVVVHTPEHVRSIAQLSDDQIDLVAEAWQRRRAAAPEGYLHALINEGRVAGSSLPHTHSQLVWLPDRPPAVTIERDVAAALDAEQVFERDGIVAVCPRAGRVPYETLIAPTDEERDPWTSDRLGLGLRSLAEIVRRLHRLGGPVPLNAWLHAGLWWHIELVPRLTVLAGIELGADIFVNTLAPEEAARQLRDASD